VANELEERNRRFLDFDLDGGHPALDFTNTVDWRGTEREHDWLDDPLDLVAFGQRAELLREVEAGELACSVTDNPVQATRLLSTARRLREALFGLFNALRRKEQPRPEDLRLFNRHLRRALSRHTVLAPGAEANGAYRLSFSSEGDPLERFLFLLLRKAADLLTTVDPRRLKICSTPECGWLFLDTSKNGSRRWCDMASCGNRSKAQRYPRQARVLTSCSIEIRF
jgi:predicted RNA-binding Zn ribbon-like protein